MGSFATTEKDVMHHVMQVLKERNKLFWIAAPQTSL